ncbi:T9SS type B sorting domain-containing protein, partial [Chitinophaga arvensicola]
SEAVTGLTASAFTLQNATASTLQSADGITYTVLITPAATGQVTISLPADVAVNVGRNGNTAAPAAVNVTADLTIPAVTLVAVPADGYYNATQSLSFTVTYNKVVTVVGTPSLRITIGAKTADAVYTVGSGTNTLTFAYAIQPGDNDMNGIALAASIQLNTGSIRDQWANDALLPLNNVASTANVFVNTQHPSVSLSTAAAATVGKPFTVTAVFSEVVTGLTASAFTLQNATASTLQSADGITYTVLITPAATGPVTVSLPAEVAVNIGRNGNSAAPAAVNVTADLTIPAVTQVLVPTDGYYNATQSLSFTVTYNKVVTVVGTPSLRVTVGVKNVDAIYIGGSGTTTLTFVYAIQPGDNDMNGVALAASIQLNAGSIRDQWANDALLPLNNVASTNRVFVNTTQPGVVLSTFAGAIVKAPFTVTATFTEVVTGVTTTDFVTSNATVSDLLTTDQITYTILVSPVADGPLSITLPAAIAVNIAQNPNTAANTIQLSVSTTPPVVNQPPVMDPVPAQQICSTTEAQSLQLTGASPVETGQTLSYFIAADQPYFNSLTVSNTGLVSYSLKTGISGAVNISIIIKDNGGTANGGVDSLQRNFTLTVNPLPVISISSDKGTATFKGDIVLLTATGGNTYTWANADGIISGQQEAALKVKMLANTTFQVAAVDANGCGNTAKISISVNDDFKVKATNILTPNGDGKNDKWIVQYLEAYPDNEVSIYDRLGRLVYQRRNYSNDWDGTMNGTPLAEGTYYYIINIKENNRVVKGFITLLRDR